MTRPEKQLRYATPVSQPCGGKSGKIRTDPFMGLFATLDTSGCSAHSKDIDDAWKKAQKVIQDAIDNNNVPTWGGQFFDCLSDDKRKIPVKCGCVGSWLRCGGSMVSAHGIDTIYLCPSAFDSDCQLATALAVEAAKIGCGVTTASGEYQFNFWLRKKLGCGK